MPRLSRVVFFGVPHHITQRGNRRADVFFTDADKNAYLELLQKYSQQNNVEILAYCLMTNHIHLIAIPEAEDGLHRVLKPLHMRYAQRVNRQKGWIGHFWQGRFFSSPLDDAYLWASLRYVERNPVRAGIVAQAEDYRWSSAAAHCGKCKDPILTKDTEWLKRLEAIDDWSSWLSIKDEQDKVEVLRTYIMKGLPCGSDKFILSLEKRTGRNLKYRKQGRQPKG
ncbi:MAG: transposase [Nitrospinae bacterium]|nr:transposase [Nitrospinota bacterium]